MSYTFSLTERERQVMLEALKFLTDLLSKVQPAAPEPAKPPAPGVKSAPVTVTARIWKAESGTTITGAPCMRIKWGTQPTQPGQGAQTHTATCFDTKYFPSLTNAVKTGQPIKFVVLRRGNYLNILSVAA